MKSRILTLTSGLVLGSLLAFGTLATVGGGHGSLWPGAIAFGILAFIISWSEIGFAICGTIYYLIAAQAFHASVKHQRASACIFILSAHWVSVAAIAWHWRLSLFNEPLRRIHLAFRFQPIWFAVVIALLVITNAVALWSISKSKHGSTSRSTGAAVGAVSFFHAFWLPPG